MQNTKLKTDVVCSTANVLMSNWSTIDTKFDTKLDFTLWELRRCFTWNKYVSKMCWQVSV